MTTAEDGNTSDSNFSDVDRASQQNSFEESFHAELEPLELVNVESFEFWGQVITAFSVAGIIVMMTFYFILRETFRLC